VWGAIILALCAGIHLVDGNRYCRFDFFTPRSPCGPAAVTCGMKGRDWEFFLDARGDPRRSRAAAIRFRFIIQGAETVGPEIDSASVGDISSVPEVDLTPLTMWSQRHRVYWSPGRKATA